MIHLTQWFQLILEGASQAFSERIRMGKGLELGYQAVMGMRSSGFVQMELVIWGKKRFCHDVLHPWADYK